MTVTLVEPYNPMWPDWFKKVKSFLEPKLRDTVIRIEHFGSTSVPGMTAKPIIDIDIVVEPNQLPKTIERLESAGYVHRGDLGISGREAFDLTDEQLKADLPPHHLYVCAQDAAELRKHLAFRDFLRKHADYARRLSDLKWALCERYDSDRQKYMDGKSELVQEITEFALRAYEDADGPGAG